MKELKFKPEIGTTFNANGTDYIIEEKLSIERSLLANKMELSLFGLNHVGLKNGLVSAYNQLQKPALADAAVSINKIIQKLDGEPLTDGESVLKYCALHINSKGEDRRNIDDERINKKIEDWKAEGLELFGFQVLVLTLLPHVREQLIKIAANEKYQDKSM